MRIFATYQDALRMARADANTYGATQLVVDQQGAYTPTGWQYAVLAEDRGVPYAWSLVRTVQPGDSRP